VLSKALSGVNILLDVKWIEGSGSFESGDDISIFV